VLAAAWQRRGLLACLLYPVSILFGLLASLRRGAYRSGLLPRERLPVPVIVVGNITVGGSGKTPLVVALAEALRQKGWRPGIITRGHGGSSGDATLVRPEGDPGRFGDEAVLLARRSGCPVCAGRDRAAAARLLLASHPGCDLLIADDGLQHYRLERELELAVFDARGVMNGWLLPAGPLREPLARLASVDAIVLNGAGVSPAPTLRRPTFRMQLEAGRLYRLGNPGLTCAAGDLAGQRLHAVAGIGAPQRFFDQLAELGMAVETHAFPDHHAYSAEDLAYQADALLVTEKDAVKLETLRLPFAVWVLPVTARIDPDIAAFLLERLDGCSPA
jgi:tetraacyldisaccharide 4'-kinase